MFAKIWQYPYSTLPREGAHPQREQLPARIEDISTKQSTRGARQRVTSRSPEFDSSKPVQRSFKLASGLIASRRHLSLPGRFTMPPLPLPTPPADSRGTRAALIFALTAERLSIHYEHGQWLTEAQGASFIADWLRRSERALPLAERRQLSALSDGLARQIAGSLSREAGLYTTHEMMEALDPNYDSELARSMMDECARLLDVD